jgi:hypothetical protein
MYIACRSPAAQETGLADNVGDYGEASVDGILPDSCQSPMTQMGQEYALAVADDATGSTRPREGARLVIFLGTKLPFNPSARGSRYRPVLNSCQMRVIARICSEVSSVCMKRRCC